MNDIERLVIAAAVSGPSSRLDDRIAESAVRSPSRRPARLLFASAVGGAAAVAGAFGFWLGRVGVERTSIGPAPTANVINIAPPKEPDAPESTAAPAQVVRVSLTDEQLTAFFARPTGREGPFGDVTHFVTRNSSHPE
jgi:hypothetical protein